MPSPDIPPDLLERAKAQQEPACRELIDLFQPFLHSIVTRNLPRHTDPSDLLQDIFIKIFTKLPSFKNKQPFHHWASRIATLTCYDALRKQYRRPNLGVPPKS